MSESAPALVPLFRSEQQLRLLDVLFDRAEDELSIGELADRAGVAHATASREVGRLAKHGIVVTRALGRNTLVAANWELPWAVELRSLLAKTIGVLGRVAEALAGIDGVAEAYVFGSWASRYVGAAGPFPRDVDLLVIGAAPLREIRRAVAPLVDDLGVEVNPVVLDATLWAAADDDPFVAQVRSSPLVPIPLAVDARP